jgi:hypothetical protein
MRLLVVDQLVCVPSLLCEGRDSVSTTLPVQRLVASILWARGVASHGIAASVLGDGGNGVPSGSAATSLALLSSSHRSKNRTPLVTILKALKIISSTMSLTSSAGLLIFCVSRRRLAVLTSDDSSDNRDFRARRIPSCLWRRAQSRVKQLDCSWNWCQRHIQSVHTTCP